jgi:DnaK suppressor protein
MAKTPEHQRRTDAERIAVTGSGKLDASASGSAPRRRTQRDGRRSSPEQTRERLLAERRAAVEELARLTGASEREGPHGAGESPFEEDDIAQASERMDMSLMHRARIAERINRLTRALERLAHGEYGTCEECGRAIEPARLAAMPEVAVCRECQERRERGERAA